MNAIHSLRLGSTILTIQLLAAATTLAAPKEEDGNAPASTTKPSEPKPSDGKPIGAKQPDSKANDPKAERGGTLLAELKFGGIVSLGGLNPTARVALTAGYVFPWLDRAFAAGLTLDYAELYKDGTESGDPRLPGSGYSWKLHQQELVLMPLVMYRMTFLEPLVPYIGIGPRIYMLNTMIRGSSATVPIPESQERSTKFGVGIPVGAELALGPGALIAELLFEYGPLDHRVTGDSNTGGLSLYLGYRFMP